MFNQRLAVSVWLIVMIVVFLYYSRSMSTPQKTAVRVARPTKTVKRSTTLQPTSTTVQRPTTALPTSTIVQQHSTVTTRFTSVQRRSIETTIPTYSVYFCNAHDVQYLTDYTDQEEDKPVGQVYWKTVHGIDAGRTKFDMALNNPKTDTYISGTIMSGQIWEPDVLSVVQTYVKGPESVFVDVGANIGYYSAMAATRGASVYSVEAVWPNYARMAMTRERLGSPENWRMWRHAADMEEGRVVRLQVASRGKNAGNFKATTKLISNWYPSSHMYATTITLDQVVQEPVDLIKLDVEGQEAQVLAGATRLVCHYGVKAIVMEFTDDLRNNGQCEWRKLFQWLRTIGYRLYAANGVTPLDWKLSRWSYRGSNVLWKRMKDRVQC